LKDLKAEIEKIVEPLVNREGFDLVELKLSRYKRNFRIQIFVASEGGVTVDDCAHLSRLVGTALDTEDVIETGYILEISSPGLDRPLHNVRDFRYRIGEKMEISILAGNEEKTITGTLTGVTDDVLQVSGEQGNIDIPVAEVRRGKIII